MRIDHISRHTVIVQVWVLLTNFTVGGLTELDGERGGAVGRLFTQSIIHIILKSKNTSLRLWAPCWAMISLMWILAKSFKLFEPLIPQAIRRR